VPSAIVHFATVSVLATKVISEWWIAMSVKRRGWKYNRGTVTGICLEVQRKITKNLSQVSHVCDRDSNRRPPEYESVALSLDQPPWWVPIKCWETSNQTTRRHILDDSILHSYRHENLKLHKVPSSEPVIKWGNVRHWKHNKSRQTYEQVNIAVMLYTCIRKVLGSGYHDAFRGFPQSLQTNAGIIQVPRVC
jgi:hypothetical protein